MNCVSEEDSIRKLRSPSVLCVSRDTNSGDTGLEKRDAQHNHHPGNHVVDEMRGKRKLERCSFMSFSSV